MSNDIENSFREAASLNNAPNIDSVTPWPHIQTYALQNDNEGSFYLIAEEQSAVVGDLRDIRKTRAVTAGDLGSENDSYVLISTYTAPETRTAYRISQRIEKPTP